MACWLQSGEVFSRTSWGVATITGSLSAACIVAAAGIAARFAAVYQAQSWSSSWRKRSQRWISGILGVRNDFCVLQVLSSSLWLLLPLVVLDHLCVLGESLPVTLRERAESPGLAAGNSHPLHPSEHYSVVDGRHHNEPSYSQWTFSCLWLFVVIDPKTISYQYVFISCA